MSKERLTSLEYLNEMTGGDPEFTREMIEMFFMQIEEFKNELQEHYDAQRWKELGDLAHKAKSSVLTFGMNDLGIKLKELQLKTQQLEDTESYPIYLEVFSSQCDLAIAELKNDLTSL
ncbi:MAG: Hpt domain-containing protein [Mangrovibacterium sp.]